MNDFFHDKKLMAGGSLILVSIFAIIMQVLINEQFSILITFGSAMLTWIVVASLVGITIWTEDPQGNYMHKTHMSRMQLICYSVLIVLSCAVISMITTLMLIIY